MHLEDVMTVTSIEVNAFSSCKYEMPLPWNHHFQNLLNLTKKN